LWCRSAVGNVRLAQGWQLFSLKTKSRHAQQP
jgi:hypothetical protein